MSKSRQADADVLVRFWSLDHHRAEDILWPKSAWPKLVFAMEGTLQVETHDRLHILPTNRGLWVNVNESHPARALGRAKVRTLYFSPSLDMARETGPMEVRPLLREMIVKSCRIGPLLSTDPYARALAILIQAEVLSGPSIPTSIPMPQSDWLRSWTEAFFAHPETVPNPPTSRRTLERHILRETGLTLGQWCQQARALIGLRLLASGATVLEAASESGFETSSGFIQSFRRQFAITPGKMLKAK